MAELLVIYPAMIVVLVATLIALGALAGCENEEQRQRRHAEEERARNYSLQHACIRKHGSPVMEGETFKTCEFSWRSVFKKE